MKMWNSDIRSKDVDFRSPARLRMREFSRSMPMLLLRSREAFLRHFRPGLRAHGVTEQQWRVLRALNAVYEIEITALANATCLLAPSLSRILRDLEERELVERRMDNKDLRKSFVSLTQQGLALLESFSAESEAIYNGIRERFGQDKYNLLMNLLRDLEASLAVDDVVESEN